MSSRRSRIRILGAALVLYGLVGVVIFVVVAFGVARPLERVRKLSESVDQQRAALVDSLSQAETTIRGLSTAVSHMDTSLSNAKTAIDHASTIAHGVASNMYGLRDAMSISILGAQPLVGLASGFDTSGQNLDQLGQDITTIGTALDANRADVTSTSANMTDLADSVHALATSVDDGPDVAISTRSLDLVRLAIYAVTGWLALFALGCVILGVYLINRSRRPHVAA